VSEKVYKPINEDDVSENIADIVAFLGAIESSRTQINDRVKHLKDEYGLATTAVRAAANLIYKQNLEEVEEKEQKIKDILNICK
jgi:uncharacterized protein YktA (UPF0223 family)